MNLEKSNIREEINQKLDHLDAVARQQKSQKICAALLKLDDFKKSRCLLIYVSTNKEVDTHVIIEQCLKTGKKVVVPRVNLDRGALELREITQWDSTKSALDQNELQKGAYGIPEPREDRTKKVSWEEIDCAILPGIAFTSEGTRLGHGKGYFDKSVSKLRANASRIGLAFDFQLKDHLPEEPHDQPVHHVLIA